VIDLIHLTKTYGTVRAVDDLSLSIRKGELFGFIGPNGAGKTTTIRMIGGLLAPASGTVLIDGIDMGKDPVRAKMKIGLIPDRPFLYEKLTGLEFMRFMGEFYGVTDGRFSAGVEKWLSIFGLSERRHELIEAYSHGMKQRLIMAAALLHDPEVLVVDEPMVGLDPKGIKMVRDLFRDLAGAGTTLFMSTHTLKLAEDLCDRIGIIHRGTLIAVGSMTEIKAMVREGAADLEDAFFQLTRSEEGL
jgi:ABC-2 type transport system ATP-binding protein